jgi:RHS repeat-associated protein
MGRQQLLDLSGDGQLDLVNFSGVAPGFFERTDDEDWNAFSSFSSLPNISWSDPNLRFTDLDGDGLSDILITNDNFISWFPSLGENGFATAKKVYKPHSEESGPRLVFNDGTESIYLADMSGDGLADLVRIRNGQVCYWPCIGYGHFGAKVTMDNSPYFDNPDQYSQERIRIADIDGSGTSDIIYLGRQGVTLYFNQSGNRWSDGRQLKEFPPVNIISSVIIADLMGTGTSCLVWSSALPAASHKPVRYIDLMGSVKPYLLNRIENNLGAETDLFYTSSTKFYLKDKRDGKPWITKLPFPVHVVEKVEIIDRISGNRFVNRNVYHHGYFDGGEREFRGFGMVEQWDTEEFSALNQNQHLGPATNVDTSSHIPPILTRSWFHTGKFLGREAVSNFYSGLNSSVAGEYFREPGVTDAEFAERLLDDTIIPWGLTNTEEVESCRALNGSLLRQEIYSLDGSPNEKFPYQVTEQNYTIDCLQLRGENRHAVFLTHPHETINYHYERNPSDPRISHDTILAVDSFGNIVSSATITYGRLQPDLSLPATDQARQEMVFITCLENNFTNNIDNLNDHRTPLNSESRTYELTGIALAAGKKRFSFNEITNAAVSAVAIPYEQTNTPGLLQKRLIEHKRSLYRSNNLFSVLNPGLMESLGLMYENYTLAFTPGMLAVYGGRLTPTKVSNNGGYVHTVGDSNWWMPSGKLYYSPGPADTFVQELAFARQHFFLPQRYRTPFHTVASSTESYFKYDVYDLLIQETIDPIGNRMTAGERNTGGNLVSSGLNYRVLQAEIMMDANRNRTVVAFDTLGMVTGLAPMGKPGPATVEGDSLINFNADLTEAVIMDHFQNPLLNPLVILGQAGTRHVYDSFAYYRTKLLASPLPVAVSTLSRELHSSDPGGPLTAIQHSFSYMDGFGRVIQTKMQAEPGPVPRRDAAGKMIMDAEGQPNLTINPVSPRWAATGWTIYNNKGKAVRRFEPFFTDTQLFESDIRIGVSPVIFYDPLERVVGTLHPDYTWEKVRFSPWFQETWDTNDTVLIADPRIDADVGDFFRRLPLNLFFPGWYGRRQAPGATAENKDAATKTIIHANTPGQIHSDSLGRPFLTVLHNRFLYSDTTLGMLPTEEFYYTRIFYDIESNQREIRDAKDRTVMQYDYDMAGHKIHQASMDSGERWIFNDVTGKPSYSWDSLNRQFRYSYDAMERLTDIFLLDPGTTEILLRHCVYGESQVNSEVFNLRQKTFMCFEEAGIVTNTLYDFKNNLLHSQRQLTQLYIGLPDWMAAQPTEPDVFESRWKYDALNRPVQVILPHSNQPGTTINYVQNIYNEANLLEKVDVWLNQPALPASLVAPATASLHSIINIDYNARGQRTRVDFGNNVSSFYEYDMLTFRMIHLLTRRDALSFPGDCPQPPTPGWPGCQVQNLYYTYDPTGNITYIKDLAQQTLYFNNKRVDADASYTYDSVYRLIETTGREQLGQVARIPVNHSYNDSPRTAILFSASDGNAMGKYLERYKYDEAANFTAMIHRGSDPGNPGWTRTYNYNETSLLEPAKQNNRLTSTVIGSATEVYSVGGDGFDAHGNMLRMPQLQEIRWNALDQIQMTRRQAVDAGDTEGVQKQGERTWYLYDAGGRRIRKVTELGSGMLKDERIYLDGIEIYRRYVGNRLTRETVHIPDGSRRHLIIETRTSGNEPGVSAQFIRYQHDNHLGSASLELNQQGKLISYEEYTPYGSSSHRAVHSLGFALKRYRYTGKERDDETGLYYFGARYYACWLARWVSCDPADTVDGPNLYPYSRNNPVNFLDPDGRQANPWTPYIAMRQFDQAVIQPVNKVIRPVARVAGMGADIIHGVGRAGVDFAVGTLKLVTGVLGASWGEEALYEFVDGIRNLPKAVSETARDWDKLPLEEKAYRVATGGLLLRGAYKLGKAGVGRLASAGEKPPAPPELKTAVGEKPPGTLPPPTIPDAEPVVPKPAETTAARGTPTNFGSEDVAFGLAKPHGEAGALVRFGGEASLGTSAPLSGATSELTGLSKIVGVARDTLNYARKTLQKTGGKLRFSLKGFSIEDALNPLSSTYNSITSIEFRGVLADPYLRSRTVFYDAKGADVTNLVLKKAGVP